MPPPDTGVRLAQGADVLPLMRAVVGHFRPAPFYVTTDLFGGALPVEIVGGELSAMIGRPVAGAHRHEVPELYVLLSPEPGGAEIEIEAEGLRRRVSSPAVALIPAGVEHRFVTLRAEPGSWCLGVLLGDDRAGRPAVLGELANVDLEPGGCA